MTSPIRLADCDSSAIRTLVCSACATAACAIACDCWTCRPISATEEAISSDAAAAERTLDDDCSDTTATVADNSWVVSAVFVRLPAAASILEEADDTVRMIRPTACSNPSATCSIPATIRLGLFPVRVGRSPARTRNEFSKTCSARSAPTSSLRAQRGFLTPFRRWRAVA